MFFDDRKKEKKKNTLLFPVKKNVTFSSVAREKQEKAVKIEKAKCTELSDKINSERGFINDGHSS